MTETIAPPPTKDAVDPAQGAEPEATNAATPDQTTESADGQNKAWYIRLREMFTDAQQRGAEDPNTFRDTMRDIRKDAWEATKKAGKRAGETAQGLLSKQGRENMKNFVTESVTNSRDAVERGVIQASLATIEAGKAVREGISTKSSEIATNAKGGFSSLADRADNVAVEAGKYFYTKGENTVNKLRARDSDRNANHYLREELKFRQISDRLINKRTKFAMKYEAAQTTGNSRKEKKYSKKMENMKPSIQYANEQRRMFKTAAARTRNDAVEFRAAVK